MNGPASSPLIDGLQFCRWSRAVFEEMRLGGLAAVHVTLAYHETFRATVDRIVEWNGRFAAHGDLILPGREAGDVDRAMASNRTAIFYGLQNPLPIEDDLGLVEVLHALGVRFMQLTYNNQSLLGSGWQEPTDGGLTRMGRGAVAEMNRLGMAIDLSHAGERTALDVIGCSTRAVSVTHANPAWWRDTARNVSKDVVKALAEADGMLGLSLYPHHLAEGSATTLENFCAMAADVAALIGVHRLGIGSDLCQGQPDEVVRWMREGRWTTPDPAPIVFPEQPAWFRDNRDFPGLREGLRSVGFSEAEAALVLGGNWYGFMARTFVAGPRSQEPSS